MKVIDRNEFLNLPPGVIYVKIEPCIFDRICIKHDSLENDWYYRELFDVKSNDSGEFVDIIFAAINNGKRIPLDFDTIQRDGLYEENQKFAIFEKGEVKELILVLVETLENYPNI